MTYYGNINTDLLNWIPLTAGHVLELGCGEASLGAEYKMRNPAARYVGVEMHGAAAEVAATRLDRLITGDFEAMTDEAVTEGRPFDAIVMGDVLEHLRDPAAVLARLHGLLADDGVLVLSVPNVAHWSVLQQLFAGRWPQQDSGLFDRTHLRWFTEHSLIEQLAAAGFSRMKMRPRRFLLNKEQAERWLPPMADLAASMGLDRDAFLGRAQTLQYVVVARKAAAPATPSLHLAINALAPRLLEVRAQLPAEYLQSAPDIGVAYAEKTGILPQLPLATPKVAIMQRPSPPEEANWIGFLANAIRAGWVVVTELDDHPDLIAQVHNRTDSSMTWLPVRAAHAAQTSTPALAEAFRAMQPEVGQFANAVFSLPPFPAERSGPARIFYGALNRERYSRQVAAALAPAIAAHPDAEFSVVHDRAFFDALPTEKKRFLPVLPYSAYLEEMAGCDIALMPLEGSAPERFKSDVKFIEASSPAVYAETIRDGATGLIAAAPDDFATHLATLLADPARRRTMARTAWEEVRDTRMFAQQIEARRAWYWSLWARRAELERSLRSRFPALDAALSAG